MKIKAVWEKVPLKNYIYLALGLNTLVLILIFVLKGFLPPEVPLFYGNAVGETQLVKTLFLIVAPLSSLAILLLNTFLSSTFSDIFLKRALIVASLFVSALTTITVVKVILLVGFF